MRYFVTLGGREIAVDVTPSLNGWKVACDGRELSVDAVNAGGATSLRIEGRVFDVILDGSAPHIAYALGRSRGVATIENERTRAAAPRVVRDGRAGDVVLAPMPGRIVRVAAEVGHEIVKGAPLVVIEAMKMENELRASRDGRVAEVLVQPGDTVERGARLVVLVTNAEAR